MDFQGILSGGDDSHGQYAPDQENAQMPHQDQLAPTMGSPVETQGPLMQGRVAVVLAAGETSVTRQREQKVTEKE